MPTAPVGEMISHSVPYIQHKQIRSNNNFRSYVESIIISDHVLRTGKKPALYQKSYQLNTGTQSYVLDFRRANKQLFFTGVPLVYEKSDQHKTIYDSCNIELASTKLQSLKSENASNTCSPFNKVKFDVSSKHDKLHILYIINFPIELTTNVV